MSLRGLVLALLLANLGFWAWSQAWLRDLGLPPPGVLTEPERLARQVRPEALLIAPPAAAPSATENAEPAVRPALVPTPVPAPVAAAPTLGEAPAEPAPEGVCLLIGPFDARQAEALRSGAAAVLPPDRWRMDESQLPSRWMVYVGPLADAAALASKRAELRELGVDLDRPGAAFEPGLSLGRFGSQEAAERALVELGRKGVRTARVVPERPDTPVFTLRLLRVDAALRSQLAALPLLGREPRPCE